MDVKGYHRFFIICKHCPLHTQTVWTVEHAVTFPYLARPTAFNPYRTSVWCSSGWLVDGDRCMELSQYFNFQQLPHYTHVAYSSRSFPWGLYLCVLWCWSGGVYPTRHKYFIVAIIYIRTHIINIPFPQVLVFPVIQDLPHHPAQAVDGGMNEGE